MQFDFKPAKKTPIQTLNTNRQSEGERVSWKVPLNTKAFTSFIFFTLGLLCIVVSCFHLWGMTSTWNKKTPIGILALTDDSNNPVRTHISIVWIDPRKSEVLILHFPDELELTIDRFGSYPLSSIEGLITQENLSPHVMSRMASLFLGVHLSGSIHIPRATTLSVGDLRYGVFSMLFGGSKTTFGYADRIAIAEYVLASNKRVIEEDVPTTVFLSSKNNTEPRLQLDSRAYSAWLERRIRKDFYEQEGISIAVINASGKKGIGATVAQALETIGFSILSIGDTSEPIETGKLVLGDVDDKRSRVTQALVNLFAFPIEMNADEAQRKRAQILLYIGKNDAQTIPR